MFLSIIMFIFNNRQCIEHYMDTFYLILQWYFVLILFMNTTPTLSIYNIHCQLGQLQTIIVLYKILWTHDYQRAYTIAISYYIFDLIQMVVLKYRRNLNENVLFCFHHLISLYVMCKNNQIYYPIVVRLELSNLSFIMYHHLKHVTQRYKIYIHISTFCWYTYLRVFSVLPYFSLTPFMTSYERIMWYVFYIMGLFWSWKLLYRCIT